MRPATLTEDGALLRLQRAEFYRDRALDEYEAARRVVEEAIGSTGGIEGEVGRVTWRSGKKTRTFLTRWFDANRFNGEVENG